MRSTGRKPFLMLSNRWGIGSDHEQWILYQYQSPDWRPVSFIASTKEVLLRCIRERGVEIPPHAEEILETFPDTFREWVRQSENNAVIATAA